MGCAVLDILGITDIRTMPERVMEIVAGDLPVRNALYRECIESYGGDLSYDWFQEVYFGDVLENRVERKYILLNRTDDALGFSEVTEDKDRNMYITREDRI